MEGAAGSNENGIGQERIEGGKSSLSPLAKAKIDGEVVWAWVETPNGGYLWPEGVERGLREEEEEEEGLDNDMRLEGVLATIQVCILNRRLPRPHNFVFALSNLRHFSA